MKTMMLINYIVSHPEYHNIVILDEGDRTPMEAIGRLSGWYEDEREIEWKINGSLEKNTLLVY